MNDSYPISFRKGPDYRLNAYSSIPFDSWIPFSSKRLYSLTNSYIIILNTATSLTFIFPLWRCGPTLARATSFFRFLDYTQRRTAIDRTFLDEWPARRKNLYLTTHNTHNRQISMPAVGFESTIPASERPQTHALDRAATRLSTSLNTAC